jgi:putative FmdB family regulatory protein
MPIYEYLCDDCGEHYERIVMNGHTKITCPKCESSKKTIQLSVFAAPANGGKSSGGSSMSPATRRTDSGGGGCCGGGCGCH